MLALSGHPSVILETCYFIWSCGMKSQLESWGVWFERGGKSVELGISLWYTNKKIFVAFLWVLLHENNMPHKFVSNEPQGTLLQYQHCNMAITVTWLQHSNMANTLKPARMSVAAGVAIGKSCTASCVLQLPVGSASMEAGKWQGEADPCPGTSTSLATSSEL